VIIKGGSRGGPEQLARHLQRTDTNETVRLLQVQSANPALVDAFRDWQTLSEGTRGKKGLYHANIDPAADYAMTEEQWQRCVEVLEKELGFEGQPRAVVMHQKHGRQHIHVVWARTDIDTMTLRSDSQNYLAHERASKALELEFGHAPVPGKHAKRDRKRQPEFPRSEATHAEWQQCERTGLGPAERREQIAALKQSCDSAEAFRAALEENGYLLARGDRRDFVIVDEAGESFSLSRQLRGMKAAEFKSFMQSIDPEALPSVDQAAALQAERATERPNERDAAAPQESQTKTQELSPEEIASVQDAVRKRHNKEIEKWRELHAFQLTREEFRLDGEAQEKAAALSDQQRVEMEKLKNQIRQETSGIRGFIEAIQARWNPTAAAEKAKRRAAEIGRLKWRQIQELKDYRVLLEQNKQDEIEDLKERQAQQLRDQETRTAEELVRHVRDAESAKQLAAEVEEQRRQEERQQDVNRDGPERPPPRAR
jgi:hypothetical protein